MDVVVEALACRSMCMWTVHYQSGYHYGHHILLPYPCTLCTQKALEVGDCNKRVMAMLSDAHVNKFGAPEPSEVRLTMWRTSLDFSVL